MAFIFLVFFVCNHMGFGNGYSGVGCLSPSIWSPLLFAEQKKTLDSFAGLFLHLDILAYQFFPYWNGRIDGRHRRLASPD